VQVNPTASISGLLDKLVATAGLGRALGRALAGWERLARDPDTTIALALSAPVIADGLRETLVYAVERRYVDTIVASADDLFADLYEALGHAHFAGEDGPVATAAGREHTVSFFAEFLAGLAPDSVATPSDLWRALGTALPTRVPRKGLLQAAAASGVRIFTPNLGTSAFGAVLLAARGNGVTLTLDAAEDVAVLARILAATPRLGILRAGEGPTDALITLARDSAPALGLAAPTLSGSVTLGARRAVASGEHHVALPADAALALPLIVTGLAQRLATARRSPSTETTAREVTPAEEPIPA
jgi:deoxyhypusine synthase